LFSPSEEVKTTSIENSILEASTSLALGTYFEGCILFHVPLDESPRELYFKIEIIEQKQVKIRLG
jgi:hypothetical protein